MAKKVCITFRTQPETKKQLKSVADDFGLDVNGVLNLLATRFIGQLAAEAQIYKHFFKEAGNVIPLFEAWRQSNPDKRRPDFLAEFRKHVAGEPSSLDGLEQIS